MIHASAAFFFFLLGVQRVPQPARPPSAARSSLTTTSATRHDRRRRGKPDRDSLTRARVDTLCVFPERAEVQSERVARAVRRDGAGGGVLGDDAPRVEVFARGGRLASRTSGAWIAAIASREPAARARSRSPRRDAAPSRGSARRGRSGTPEIPTGGVVDSAARAAAHSGAYERSTRARARERLAKRVVERENVQRDSAHHVHHSRSRGASRGSPRASPMAGGDASASRDALARAVAPPRPAARPRVAFGSSRSRATTRYAPRPEARRRARWEAREGSRQSRARHARRGGRGPRHPEHDTWKGRLTVRPSRDATTAGRRTTRGGSSGTTPTWVETVTMAITGVPLTRRQPGDAR